MKIMKSNRRIIPLLALLALLASLPRSQAQGTFCCISNLTSGGQDGVTYQGQLMSTGGGPVASGSYDFVFTLFSTNTDGSPVAGPVTNTATAVNSNGLFTTLIFFPYNPTYLASRQSNYLYLEIAVATNGNGSFTTLTPRQLLTPALQAMYAVTAGTANGVSASAVIQVQSLSVGTNNSLSGAYATITGGSGNNANADYGTISGGFGNTVSSNSDTVSGGSVNTASGPYATVGGGTSNTASGLNATVGGGSFNNAMGTNATIAGGDNNIALDYDFIGGGQSNVIGNAYSVICGGLFNYVHEPPNNYFQSIVGGYFNNTYALACIIGGGAFNTIQLGANLATISGGYQNTIQTSAVEATIAGGTLNTIQTGASDAAIAGGYGNTMQTSANYSFIGGGTDNTIKTYASDSTIGGGYQNTIGGGLGTNTTTFNTAYATVSGGSFNTASNNNSTVSGGVYNVAGAQFSTVGGGGTNYASGSFATISGGTGNAAGGNAAYIGGGFGNTAAGGGDVVGGGLYNSLPNVSAGLRFIGGGSYNSSTANLSGIASGGTNTIQLGANSAFIGGGDLNLIQSSAYESIIGGGTSNTIQMFSVDSTIGGGSGNLIGGGLYYNTNTGAIYGTNISYSTISGGYGNSATNAYTTVPGGQQAVAGNYAQLAYSSGEFLTPGDSQYSVYVLRGTTSTNCVTCNTQYLYLDGQSLEIALPSNRSLALNLSIVARTSGTGAKTTVYLVRAGASGTTGNTGTPVVDMPLNELLLSPTDVALSVSSGYLHVQVTGTGGSPINWTATIQATEEAY